MGDHNLKIRAVICDIYQTLLRVGPPPPNAEERWQQAWRQRGCHTLPPSLAELRLRCQELVSRAHALAHAKGVAYPEVCWPEIMMAALPELKPWSEAQRADLVYEHAQLVKTITPMPGAAKTLIALSGRGLVLGLCSNCQAYTLQEFRKAFTPLGVTLDHFRLDLRFFSFEAGFSKPNPEAFRQLQRSLHNLGIPPEATLMVGDRLDNDLLPAAAEGWCTWLLGIEPSDHGGTWEQLPSRIFQA